MSIHFSSLAIGDVFKFQNYGVNNCVFCCKITYYIKDYGLYCYCYDCKYKYNSSPYEHVLLIKTISV